jgi:hypothetical protein
LPASPAVKKTVRTQFPAAMSCAKAGLRKSRLSSSWATTYIAAGPQGGGGMAVAEAAGAHTSTKATSPAIAARI